jgi:antitoxin YefM
VVSTLSLKERRLGLSRVIRHIDGTLDRYVITKRGKPVVVMTSIKDDQALMETLDVFSDPKAMAGLRQGEQDIQKGKVHSWSQIKESLGHYKAND